MNWNGREDTLACLASLEADGLEHIIVVDNGSIDGSVEAIREHHPAVVVVEMGENLGYIVGANTGVELALADGSDPILLLNNDATLEPGCMAVLEASLEGRVAMAGPKILYHDRDEIWFAGGEINETLCFTRHSYMDEPDRAIDGGEVDFLTGCVTLFRARALEEIGLLDESYHMYFEDTDICLRARRAGWSCILVPEAVARHRVSASAGNAGSNELTPFRAYYFGRNPFLIINKYMQGARRLTGIAGQFLVRLPVYAWRSRCSQEVMRRYLRGIRDGLAILERR